ncbi:MAG: hypothetical protein R6W88_00445 [Desulfobacterales bacterium]
MTEPNEPDKKIEKTESTEDDDQIIDLVDAVETEDDDQIIDLVDDVEMEDDDQIIDLVDDAVEISQKDDSESIVGGVSEPVENETIIDLVESIGDTPEEIEEIGEPVWETVEDSQDIDDTPEFEDNLIVEAVDFDDKFDTESIVPEALKDDFADSLGVELDSNEDISKNTLEADNVSDEQVEAALERVIKKLFYEKIDRLLVETIEKTVTKEIERLKKAMLEDQAYGEK